MTKWSDEEPMKPMEIGCRCKNCSCEISPLENNANGGYCDDCWEEANNEFGKDSNGTY